MMPGTYIAIANFIIITIIFKNGEGRKVEGADTVGE